MITETISVNLVPSNIMPVIHAVQRDTGLREYKAKVYNGSSVADLTGMTCRVEGTKSDKTGFSYPCTISGNEVTFATNGQMTVYAEDIVCGLVFSNDGDSITAKFILSVEKAPLADDTEISDTDLSILSNMRGVTA